MERKQTHSKKYYDDEIKAIGPNGEIVLKDNIRRVTEWDIEEKAEDLTLKFRIKMTKLKERIQTIRDEEKNFD